MATPEGWLSTTIGALTKVRRGASPRPIQDPRWFAPTGPGWVRISDVSKSHRVLRTTEQRLSPDGEARSVRVRPGDLILSIAATIGKPIILGIDACIHDGFVYFPEIDRKQVDLEFLYYFFQAKQPELTGQGQPGTQKNINTEIVESICLGLPPLPEQRKIAAILASADDAIEGGQAVIDQLQVVKKAMMAELLTRGVPGRHTRFKQTAIGVVPEDWEVARVDEVGEPKLGRMRSPVYTEGKQRPYLRVANVLDGYIDTSDVLEMPFEDESFEIFRLRDGDILLNEGQSLHLVGRSAVYRGDPPDCAFQKTLLRFRPGPRLHGGFAQLVFQWWLYVGRFAEHAVQTTSIAHLTGVRFAAMTMAVPTIAEQQEIAETLGAVDERLDAERRLLHLASDVKRLVSGALLSGEVRVTPDEPSA